MSPPSEHERHAQFLRHYAESEVALHTFVRSLVSTRQMASEVMQDMIPVLWEKFDAAADFHGWAFGVAKNVALHHLRQHSRDRHVFDDELVNQFPGGLGGSSKRKVLKCCDADVGSPAVTCRRLV